MAPFFSKALVQQLEPSVDIMIQKLVDRLEKLKGTGTVINMIDMYPCLTSDISKTISGATLPSIYLEPEPEMLRFTGLDIS